MNPTSEPIPREQLSAWQRWEMASFDRHDTAVDTGAAARAEVEAEAARIRAAAAVAGRAEGYAAGIAAAQDERAELAAVIAALAANAAEREQQLADEVLDFALVLARQIVGEALAVRRDYMLPVVSAALRQVPPTAQGLKLRLNPADMRIVESFLADTPPSQPYALIADAAIAAGGCRLETEHSSIDATTRTRWRRLLAALGRSDEWLEPA